MQMKMTRGRGSIKFNYHTWFQKRVIQIIAMSHERRGVSNQGQFDSLCNSLFRTTTTTTLMLPIAWPVNGCFTSQRVINAENVSIIEVIMARCWPPACFLPVIRWPMCPSGLTVRCEYRHSPECISGSYNWDCWYAPTGLCHHVGHCCNIKSASLGIRIRIIKIKRPCDHLIFLWEFPNSV